jgi:hypothetical protein
LSVIFGREELTIRIRPNQSDGVHMNFNPEPAQPIALQIPEAVRLSALSRSTLYIAIKDGRLPIRKSGARTLILAADLRKFIESLPISNVPKAA